MASQLIKYATGEVTPTREERPIAKQARKLFDEVRIAGLVADGQVALTAHIMEQVVELDARRRELAGDDPITNSMLADIEIEAVRQLKRIANDTYRQWKL